MKIKKYLNPSGNLPVWQAPVGEDWQKEWKYRLTPASRSKVAGGWSNKGKVKRASESGELYTKRRIKEETKRTWRSDAADIAHGIGEGALALHPYTAIPYYGAKVGQDILNGNVNWSTALNASIPLFHLSPQAVGLKEATNVALEDAANAGSKTARNWRVAREINLGIKLNTKNGKIEVTDAYFNSPDKWYRITETPEKYGIMELGKNVTTHDAPLTQGTINGWRSSVLNAKVTKGAEGFIKKPPKIELNIRRKNGQAHGNTSQAAKGKLWGGTTSGSRLFPEGVIEGQAPSMINYGLDRTNFVITPWELVPNGGRVGFHTGEMPMSNLGWFQRTNKGTYTYEPIIPEKRITYLPILLLEPSTSLAFFERKPSTMSQITTENATSITPEQWTAAQDAAIARGDMAEAQRLRDLHFKVSAPNTTTVNELGDPTHNYHGTTSTFTAFDPQKVGTTTGDKSGFFFTDNKSVANFYSHETGSAWNNLKLMLGLYKGHKPQIYDVYLNTTKPMITDFHGGVDEVGREILAKEAIKNGNDANILQNIIDGPPALPHNVTIMRNPKHIKSADAITYDNNGVRIPLGKRDNFNINDIRYGLLPFGIGLTGYGLYKRKLGGKMNILLFLKNGSGIHIKKKNRGKFTDYCGGKVTDSCIRRAKASGNPTLVKRATFADNARHFKHRFGGLILQEFKLRKMLNKSVM